MAGGGVSTTIRRLLEERRLIRARLGHEAVRKELSGAEYDLRRADASLSEGDFKWATVKAYYSMFHAARALLYTAGYRERSHAALVTALRELYVKPGKLAEDALGNFENAMDLREEADYALTFSEQGARRVVKDAERFIVTVRTVLQI
ncbi:MAG: HEPN domain-containing protein [Thaumarchaeota archaeon]|nr:HEPN domain-containing protein [Nitrososphaerota archaeon]